MTRLRRILRFLAYAAAFTVFAAVAGYGLLQTEPGRAAFARTLARALSDEATRVDIEGITGRVPQRMRVGEVRVADADGTWLRATDLALEWRPLQLLWRRYHATALEAGTIELSRLPARGQRAKRQTSADGVFRVPTLRVNIAVERLQVEHLLLGADLLGQAADIAVNADRLAYDARTAALTLRADRLDGIEGHVRADVAFRPAAGELSVDITARDGPGGLLAAAAQAPDLPAGTLALQGAGALDDWRGALRASVGDLAHVDAGLRISGARERAVAADGRANLTGLVRGPAADLLGQDFAFALLGAWTRNSFVLRHASVEGPTATARFAGACDLGTGAIAGELNVEATNTTALNAYLAPVGVGALSTTTSLEGSIRRPRARGELLARDVSGPEFTARELQAHFALDIPETDAEVFRFDATLTARATGVETARDLLRSTVGDTVTASLDAGYMPSQSEAEIHTLELQTQAVTASGRGRLSFDPPAGTLTAVLRASDVSGLGKGPFANARGAVTAEVDLRSDDLRTGLEADVRMTSEGVQTGQEAVDTLVGPAPRATATLLVGDWQTMRVSNLVVDGRYADLDGTLELREQFAQVQADATLRMADLAPLSPLLKTNVDGRGALRLHAAGPLRDLTVNGDLQLEDGAIDRVQFSRARADYAFQDLDPLRGSVEAEIANDAGRVRAATDLALQPETSIVEFTNSTLDAPGVTASGALAVPLRDAPLRGRMTGQASDLAALAAWLGQEAEGALTFDVAIADEDGVQRVDATVEGTALDAPVGDARLECATVAATLQMRDPLHERVGTLALQAKDLRTKDVLLDTLAVDLDGSPARMDFTIAGAGQFHGPIAWTARGDAELAASERRVRLAAFDATAFEQPVRLERPATVVYGPDLFAVEDLDATVATGRIAGAGRLTPREVEADVTLRDLPLALARLATETLGLQGRVDGELHVTGTPGAPNGTARLQVREIRAAMEQTEDVPDLSAQLDATLEAGTLRATADVAGLADTHLEARATLPVGLSVRPPGLTLTPDTPLDATASLRGDVGALWPLLAIDRHRMTGMANGQVTVGGTLGAPTVAGEVHLTGGVYEDIDSGMYLADLRVDAVADRRAVTLTQATATDGGAGTFAATGALQLDAAADYPLDFQLRFTDAYVLRRDEITAVASGDMSVGGTAKAAVVSGKITTTGVEARLTESLPPEVVKLEVIELNAPESGGEPAPARPPRVAVPALDVTFDMPGRVFVRGRGLDSEWSGNLHITGTAEEPIVEGVLTPVRGQFIFASKVFTLQKGTITFDGGKENDPLLNLSAVYERVDMQAIFEITGRASRPTIALTSRPQLPQDEILARVLFNKSAGSLSPWEALQLANAVAILSGRGTATEGIMDIARRTLGVDVLRVGSSEEGDGPTVTVGSYLAEGVYVGVDQGMEPGDTAVNVEVQVRPNLSVESEVGMDASSSIGVKWKRDY